jgi:hypothetical protein
VGKRHAARFTEELYPVAPFRMRFNILSRDGEKGN